MKLDIMNLRNISLIINYKESNENIIIKDNLI